MGIALANNGDEMRIRPKKYHPKAPQLKIFNSQLIKIYNPIIVSDDRKYSQLQMVQVNFPPWVTR